MVVTQKYLLILEKPEYDNLCSLLDSLGPLLTVALALVHIFLARLISQKLG